MRNFTKFVVVLNIVAVAVSLPSAIALDSLGIFFVVACSAAAYLNYKLL